MIVSPPLLLSLETRRQKNKRVNTTWNLKHS